jgi:hypothetical protein
MAMSHRQGIDIGAWIVCRHRGRGKAERPPDLHHGGSNVAMMGL